MLCFIRPRAGHISLFFEGFVGLATLLHNFLKIRGRGHNVKNGTDGDENFMISRVSYLGIPRILVKE